MASRKGKSDFEKSISEDKASLDTGSREKTSSKSTSKASKPEATGVKVHPINVAQGDAILLEIKYNNGSSKKYLIDGGTGQHSTATAPGVSPYGNLISTLENIEGCIGASTGTTTGNQWKDRSYQHVNLDAIVVTHPDRDHLGGINALLGSGSQEVKGKHDRLTVCCPIITTTATRLFVNRHRGRSEHREGDSYIQDNGPVQFCFQEKWPGRKHSSPGDFPQRTTVKAELIRDKKEEHNETSILTTVQLDSTTNPNYYDVVLTGDSNSDRITTTLKLGGKHVGIFQVPHHGSRLNYGGVRSIEPFYSTFTADIYLISHGNHGQYKHPHSEVITAIIKAAQTNRNKIKIVVTATWFDTSKIATEYDWRPFVDIYCFKKDTKFVTLDPQATSGILPTEKLLTEQCPALEESNDSVHVCHVCARPTNEEGIQTAICNVCKKRAHADRGQCTPFKKKTVKTYCCTGCGGCAVCNKSTNEKPRDKVTCNICKESAYIHPNCLRKKCDEDDDVYTYTCRKCLILKTRF